MNTAPNAVPNLGPIANRYVIKNRIGKSALYHTIPHQNSHAHNARACHSSAGQGSFGEIFLGYDVHSQQHVAIKLVRFDLKIGH